MQGILSDQELCFLLGEEDAVPIETPAAAPDGLDLAQSEDGLSAENLTDRAFSGELPEIQLLEVFETLAQTGTEGVVVISNPVEEHYLWLRDGQLRDWVPNRVESRRIGSRLLSAGLITPIQLDQAVQEQRSSDQQIGEILIARGLVTEQQVSEAASTQALEDIYSLFVWTEGSVEFQSGAPSGSQRALLDSMPSFDVTRVLEEVRRREPEWAPILENLGSLQEVLVVREAVDYSGLSEVHRTVLEALDGKATLVELAKETEISLFDCALAVKELYDLRAVGVAPPEQLIGLAESHLESSDRQNAIMVLRNLAKRVDVEDVEMSRRCADMLAQCKEGRMASDLLIRVAHASDEGDLKLELARLAHRIDPGSKNVLSYLRNRLEYSGAADQELLPIACAYCDCLIRDGWLDEAYEVVAQFTEENPDDTPALSRRVRILAKLGRNQDAVEQLLKLADLCKAAGYRDRLIRIYEGVLRLDGSRSDVESALLALRRGTKGRLIRAGVAVVVILSVSITGLVWYRSSTEAERKQAWLTDVRGHLEAGDLVAARALIDGAPDLSSEGEGAELATRVSDLETRELDEHEHSIASQLGAAADAFDRGNYESALGQYQALRQQAELAPRVAKAIEMRFGALGKRLGELAGSLPGQLPAPPDELDSPSEVARTLESLEAAFRAVDLASARGVLAIQKRDLLTSVIGEEQADSLRRHATEIEKAFGKADALRELFDAALHRADSRVRLESLWTDAQKHEKAFAIRKAHEIYKRLAAEYPAGEDGLRTVFENKRDRYGEIVVNLEKLEALCDAGDVEGANRLFASMTEADSELPYDKLVELPLQVVSYPSGATVFVNDVEVGTTPVASRYSPAGTPSVRIELDGFQPVTHSVKQKVGLVMQVVLVKLPEWRVQLDGVAEHRPVFDRGEVFVADRSGSVTALRRASGDQLWSQATDDLSGLLPTPIVWKNQVVVCSLDGPVRAYSRESAVEAWRVDGYPCESVGFVLGSTLVFCTTDRRLVGLDLAAGGAERFEAAIPGTVVGDPSLVEKSLYAVTDDGWLFRMDVGPDGAREAWRVRVGEEVLAGIAVADGLVIAVDSSGNLRAVRRSNGKVAWKRSLLGYCPHSPVVAGGRVLVAVRDELRSFGATDGTRGPTFLARGAIAADPVAVGGVVLVGDRDGIVAVVDPQRLDLRYQLRGPAAVAGPPAIGPDGVVLIGFEDRSVYAYADVR